MKKDMFKITQLILKDTSLKPAEKTLLLTLTMYYNHKNGYAHPSYKTLRQCLSTPSNDTVRLNALKLQEKGYISIEPIEGDNNRYYINKHLYFIEEKESGNQNLNHVEPNAKPKDKTNIDSDGNTPVDGQIHAEEVLEDERITLVKSTITTGNVSEKLKEEVLETSKDIVVIACEEAKFKSTEGKINSTFLLRSIRIVKEGLNNKPKKDKKLKFDNFESRLDKDPNYYDEFISEVENSIGATTTSSTFFICEKCEEGNLNTREQGQICQDCGYDNK